jgi:Fic-DOC domain mobile mystery protein B
MVEALGLGAPHAPGATPLDPDEAAGLIPGHISTQSELNEWEQANILEAGRWLKHPARKREDVLSERFARELHKRMFHRTWKWAGTFRRSDKNIGIDWRQIGVQLRNLLDDVKYQLEHKTYPADEIATRFHHRLVSIHPFPNGNGRHARMMTDVLLAKVGAANFSWGRADIVSAGATRETYLHALQAADAGNIAPLLAFVRS